MTDEGVPPTDLLPLLFATMLVVYVLVMGSGDLARTVIRIVALVCAAFCLAVWGAAALSYAGWGRPVIDEFYATAVLARYLGAPGAGWLMIAAVLIPLVAALREVRRLKTGR